MLGLYYLMLTILLNAVQAPVGIFGVPLEDSIKYANVAISLTNEQGESYVYGYVPIVVAKCGVFLKEKGTIVYAHAFLLPRLHFGYSYRRGGHLSIKRFGEAYQGAASSV